MNKSPEIKTLAASLNKFHTQVEAVKKDSDNPFFHSKYASLDAILETIANPLSYANLTFAQFPDGENGLTTILMDTVSGEWIESTFTVPLAKNDPQGAGSALTYMRRYALGAILGLATETDDDANSASKPIKARTGTEHITIESVQVPAKSVGEAKGEPFPSSSTLVEYQSSSDTRQQKPKDIQDDLRDLSKEITEADFKL